MNDFTPKECHQVVDHLLSLIPAEEKLPQSPWKAIVVASIGAIGFMGGAFVAATTMARNRWENEEQLRRVVREETKQR